MKFKKDKEYFITTKSRPYKSRVVVSKVISEMIEKVLTQVAIVIFDETEEVIQISDITNVFEPVSNIEMFQMWVNWNNLNNPNCILYNQTEADELRQKITKTLKQRSYVMYGTGKLEAFDYKKMYEIRTDIKSENYKFEVGKSYVLQNGEIITVIGRGDTRGYECLICSDGKYRYDRSTDPVTSPEKGRCTATSHELLYPYNILNELFGNRYLLSKEFCEKERVEMDDLSRIEMESRFDELKHKFYAFLKTKNMTSIWSTYK